ncbi:helix-turn-helix domain-containing protein [Acinetobacter radioresistens]|uniref:helix-turn-helix domain-containing protein n=1 Tax=Acinetobacter radioresistens TaxID=40216 RepID=UPI002002FA66|nr:helix-turn-helix transcriptional regulator [Acinetobacter radioresistens]MCK4108877.1 transcriptional regulator [Acinetobacter radioresistens]
MQTTAESQLQIAIGLNLRSVRVYREMSIKEVMAEVWNTSERKNRLSEIENGARIPSPYILLRLALLYDIPLDFVFGFSKSIDHSSSVSSDLFQIKRNLKKTAIHMMDGISESLTKRASVLPRIECVLLLDEVRNLSERYHDLMAKDLDFRHAMSGFSENFAVLDQASTRLNELITSRMRANELSMYNHIQLTYDDVSHESLENNFDKELREEKEIQLQKTIGKNLKAARIYAKKSLLEVMVVIWGITDNKNRLKEIESGSRMPSPFILHRLAVLYNISMDFIFGLSHEIERDETCSEAGRTVQGLRELGLDIIEQVNTILSKQVKVLPRSEAMELLDSARELVYKYKNSCLDKSFNTQAKQLEQNFESLEYTCIQLDSAIARHFRAMEITVCDHITRIDKTVFGSYLTDSRIESDQPKQATTDLSVKGA